MINLLPFVALLMDGRVDKTQSKGVFSGYGSTNKGVLKGWERPNIQSLRSQEQKARGKKRNQDKRVNLHLNLGAGQLWS